jgi:hypothetical protein
MELRLVPFVRIRTTWSDGVQNETGHLEELYAVWALLLYGDVTLWRQCPWLRVGARPVKATLFDRVWCHDVPGIVQ